MPMYAFGVGPLIQHWLVLTFLIFGMLTMPLQEGIFEVCAVGGMSCLALDLTLATSQIHLKLALL